MEIKTKFNVNNLAKRKFDTDSKNYREALEVMEIISQTCYAGTQVFYLCKPIVCKKEFNERWKEDGEFKWVVGHGVSQTDDQTAWRKYREDELIEAPQELVDIILGKE